MTVTQNYGNIISSTPILSADPNVKEDVMRDQQKITILYCRLSNEDSPQSVTYSTNGIHVTPAKKSGSYSVRKAPAASIWGNRPMAIALTQPIKTIGSLTRMPPQ